MTVEFETYETARACHRGPGYRAAKAIRDTTADADFIVLEGAAA